MAIREALELVDKVTNPAARMARAIGGVEKAMGSAGKTMTTGVFGQSRGFGKVEVAAKRATKAIGGIERTTKKTVPQAKKLGGKDALGAFGLGGAIGSGIVTAGAALMAVFEVVKRSVSAALDLSVAFAKGVVEAHVLRSEGKALFDTLSGGKGDEVMARLKTQSIATGQAMASLQKTTKKARDAGLTFADAFKLNLLRGDLRAAGHSAIDADAAIGKVIDSVKKGGNASKEIAKIAKEFNVAGDGANAAAKQATTLGGLLNRLKMAPGNIFDAIATKLGPNLDKIAGKVTKFINEFVKSGKAGEMLDKVVSAVESIIAGIETAIPIATAFWEGLKEGLGPVATEFENIKKALDKAFGGDSGATMDVIATAARGIGKALGFAIGFVVKSIVMFAAFAAAIGVVAGLLAQFGSDAIQAGKDLVTGLVNGIKSGITRAVAAAQELADKVSSTVKAALKIGSPSKLFEQYGGFTAEGFAKGVTGGIGDATSALGALTGAEPANGNAVAGARGGGGGGGGTSVTIQINVSASPGATRADGERLAEGLAPVIRREIQSFLEVRALEAAV